MLLRHVVAARQSRIEPLRHPFLNLTLVHFVGLRQELDGGEDEQAQHLQAGLECENAGAEEQQMQGRAVLFGVVVVQPVHRGVYVEGAR